MDAATNDGTGFTVRAAVNEPGEVHYVVVALGAQAPTSAQVKAGLPYGAVTALAGAGSSGSLAADTDFAEAVTGLTSETAYAVYFAAEDTAGNLQSVPTMVEETTADITAPAFETNYPQFTEVRGTSAVFNVVLSERSQLFYVILPAASAAPTVADVLALQGAGGAEPLGCGTRLISVIQAGYHKPGDSWNVTAGSVDSFYGLDLPECAGTTRLEESTTYDVYFVARDFEAENAYYRSDNVMSAPVMTQLVTADKEPPAFDAGFPLVDDVTLTSFSVQVSLGEVGKVYLLVVLQGAAAPTKDDILQQASTYRGVAVVNKAVITAPVAGTTYQATLTVPPNDAAYDVYLVTEDDGDPNTRNEAGWTGPVTYAETSQTAGIFNVLPVPVKITTENMDALAPVWTGTAYTPTVVHIAGTSLDLVAQLDEPGYVHYILLPAGSNMPTSEEVRDATYAFAPVAACGVMDVDVASTNTSIAIEGETDRDKPDCDAEFYGLLAGLEGLCGRCPEVNSETDYELYVVAQDVENNLMAAHKVKKLPFRTTDITPPEFSTAPAIAINDASVYAHVPNDGGVTFGIKFAVNEASTTHFIVVPAGSQEPTAGQVRARADYGSVTLTTSAFLEAEAGAHAVNLTGIPDSDATDRTFDVYVVAEDDENEAVLPPLRQRLQVPALSNLQAAPVKLTATTADISAPVFDPADPPTIVAVPNTNLNVGFQLRMKTDEDATVYIVVVESDFTYNAHLTDGSARALPTVAEVKAGKGPGGTTPVSSYTQTLTANTVFDQVLDLSPQPTARGVPYDVYLVAEDDAHSGDRGVNIQTVVTKLEFTSRDNGPPLFDTGYPSIVVGGESVEVSVVIDEKGFFHAGVLLASYGGAAPTSATTKAGLSAGLNCLENAISGGGVLVKCTITGLKSETDYKVYVVAEDDVDSSITAGQPNPSRNIQTAPTVISFTTLDFTPPGFAAQTPFVDDLDGVTCTCVGPGGACCPVSLSVNAALDEVGTAYYVVLPSSASLPTAHQVKAGTGNDGQAAVAAGTLAVGVRDTTYAVTVNALVSETEYVLYAMAEDAAAGVKNAMVDVRSVYIETPDLTPPTFVGHRTSRGTVAEVKGDALDLVVQLDEVGIVYYVIVPAGSPAPTSANLRGHVAGEEDYAGEMYPAACGSIAVSATYANTTKTVQHAPVETYPECDFDFGFYGLGTPPPLDGSFYGLGRGNVYCEVCPRLTSETAYDIYIVAEDDGRHGFPSDAVELQAEPNLQASPTKVLRVNYPPAGPSVTLADVTAPEFVLNTPRATDLMGTGFTLHAALDEPGAIHYVASESATVPAHANVKACRDHAGNAADACGQIAIPVAQTDYTTVVTGLDMHKQYHIFVFAEDDEPAEAQADRPTEPPEGPWTQMTAFSAPIVPNESPVTAIVGDTIVTVDTTAPIFNAGYPKIENLATASVSVADTATFDITVNMDEPGTAYYVLFEPAPAGSGDPGSVPPSPAQVKACQDYKGNAATFCGNWAVVVADADASITVPELTAATPAVRRNGLADETHYIVFVVVEDDSGLATGGLGHQGLNLQSRVTKLELTTPDGTAPVFTFGYPYAAAPIADAASTAAYYNALTYVDVTVALNEPGTVLYSVVGGTQAVYNGYLLSPPTTPALPSIGAVGFNLYVTNGVTVTPHAEGTITVPSANTPVTQRITFSSALTVANTKTPFSIQLSTRDSGGNLGDGDTGRQPIYQPSLRLAPTIMDRPQGSVTETSIQVKSMLGYPGTMYYVAFNAGAPAPSVQQVLDCQDSFGNAEAVRPRVSFPDTEQANVCGASSLVGTITNVDTLAGYLTLTTVANLTRGTEYDFYFVTSNLYTGRHSETVTGRVVRKESYVTPDTTAPVFAPGYPFFTGMLSDRGVLVAKLDEPSFAYWVVLPGGAQRPSTDQVIAGTDASGSAAPVVAAGTLDVQSAANDFDLYRVSDYNTTVSGLQPGTSYDLYVAATDKTATVGGVQVRNPVNKQALATRVSFTTPSDNPFIQDGAGIQTSTGTFSPTPTKARRKYTVFVSEATTSFTITVNLDDADAAATLNGTAVASGTAVTQSLPHHKTVLEYVVTAEDNVTTATYVVDVYRGAAEATTNSTLQILELILPDGSVLNSTHMGGLPYPHCLTGCVQNSYVGCNAINPECIMDSGRTRYHAAIPSHLTQVTINAVATQPSMASIKLYTLGTKGVHYPGGLPGWTTGTDLASDKVVDLESLTKNGGDTIDLIVTAGDAVTTTRYTISIDRFGPGVYGDHAWAPVEPSTIQFGSRYEERYAAYDPLTTKVLPGPGVNQLTKIPTLDIFAPEFLADGSVTYPFVSNTTASSSRLHLQLSEPSTVYYVVVADGARAPTSREVKSFAAGGDPPLRADVLLSGTVRNPLGLTQETFATLSGLNASSAYDVYLVAEDGAKNLKLEDVPNLQGTPTKLDLTTTA